MPTCSNLKGELFRGYNYPYINPYSAGTVFIRHNLTSVRQIVTYKDGPRVERI